MVDFLKLLISKNKPDHESGALFEASKFAKKSRTTRVVHFLKLLISKNEPDHENGALFEANQQKRAGPREWCTV